MMAEPSLAQPVPAEAAPAVNNHEATSLALGKRPYPGDSPDPARRQKQQKQQKQQRPPKKKFRGRKPKKAAEGSAEEVLMADVQSLLATMRLEAVDATTEAEDIQAAEEPLPEKGTEIELEVVDLSSTGDGLAVQQGKKNRIYVVSFAVPGDIIRGRVYRHLPPGDDPDEPTYSVADLVEILRPSPELRDGLPGDSNSRVRCQYFGRCSGCQYQMLDYAEQLRIKRRVVERAYRHFSGLPVDQVPAVRDTMASPLQYGYRTKLTPHFDGPPGFRRKNRAGHVLTEVPAIGFMQKGGGPRTTLDIEQCPIGTAAVAAGMARERARVAQEFGKYSKGATILLRESTRRVKEGEDGIENGTETDPDAVVVTADGHTDIKTCITDNNATSKEYIDDYVFTNPAGSFFQNNNSILPGLTAYVRENVVRPPPKDASAPPLKPLRYLIDAYSGSGLFTITLASTLPGGSVGIDIAEQSITYARTNAELNHLPPDRCRFLAADAAQLFAGVSKTVTTDPDETVVVLDPPRKGCDGPFLRQLLAYAPARVVYVSCNVHTQARDVGILVRGHVDGDAPSGTRYAIESLRGFDFFPQTAHVEGIAVLNRVDAE